MSGLKQYRILVIDDNPAIHDDFRKVLAGPVADAGVADLEAALFGAADTEDAPRYEIDTASQGPDGLEMVRKANQEGRPYAMVFSDMRMPPGWDGVQTLREIWKIAPGQQAAICTAYSDYTPEQIAAELGVRGKMVIVRKPFDPTEVRQIAAMICEKWELSCRRGDLEKQVEARTAELKRAALHDNLTGLSNRVLFADRLGQSLQRLKREPNHKFAVLFIDCDNFKTVNDTLGHHAGDALLKQIAERLRQALREGDSLARADGATSEAVAARVGGDEFAILLRDITCDADAARVAQRLLDLAKAPYDLGGKAVRSNMSVGVTTSAIQYANADEMLRDADAAMYQAKHSGRGRYVMFDQAMHDAAVVRLGLEAELRNAVEAGQVRPHFQPIIATATGVLVGFEALARWHHPSRGVITPANFIPLAEETGIIVHLGLRILEDACRQLVAWQTSYPGLAGLTMSVNVSRKQLIWPSLVEEVRQVIARTGVNPSQIHLEVTESTVMEDARKSINVMHQLRGLQLQLHMDDFGTGHSSLSCLHTFPISGLKLDGSYLQNLTPTKESAAVLNGVARMAQGMNMPVVAEGVESDVQLAHLKAIGCEFAQGFLFAPPMDATSATAFVAGLMSVRKAA